MSTDDLNYLGVTVQPTFDSLCAMQQLCIWDFLKDFDSIAKQISNQITLIYI